MPAPNPAALEFLLTRRSRPAKTLTPVAPDRAEIEQMLTAAARVPDHGKLAPFRFLVFRGEARERLAAALAARMKAAGEPPEKVEKQSNSFRYGGAIVAVVFTPRPPRKVPEWEQHLAAGCACLSLLNAALAMGWANWLTGWAAESREFMEAELGLAANESVAGFIHLGGEAVAPSDRSRPDIAEITDWIDA